MVYVGICRGSVAHERSLDIFGRDHDLLVLLGGRRSQVRTGFKVVSVLLGAGALAAGVVTGRMAGVPVGAVPMAEPAASKEPAERARQRALQLAAVFLPQLSPLAAKITLSVAVTHHRHQAGSCVVYPPEGQSWEAEADYVTEIQARTLFGIPVRRFRITCGGTAIE